MQSQSTKKEEAVPNFDYLVLALAKSVSDTVSKIRKQPGFPVAKVICISYWEPGDQKNPPPETILALEARCCGTIGKKDFQSYCVLTREDPRMAFILNGGNEAQRAVIAKLWLKGGRGSAYYLHEDGLVPVSDMMTMERIALLG